MAHGFKYIIDEWEPNKIGGAGYVKWSMPPEDSYNKAMDKFEQAIKQGRKVRFIQLSETVMFNSDDYKIWLKPN